MRIVKAKKKAATKRKAQTPRKKLTKYQKIYQLLKKACLACQKRGISITEGRWGVRMSVKKHSFIPLTRETYKRNHVCPLGALLVHLNGDIQFEKFFPHSRLRDMDAGSVAGAVLGVDEEWVSNFIGGVDAAISETLESDSYNSAAARMGRRLRRELKLAPSAEG